MKNIFQNIDFVTVTSVFGSVITLFATFYFYWKKRQADMHFISLIKNSKEWKNSYQEINSIWDKELTIIEKQLESYKSINKEIQSLTFEKMKNELELQKLINIKEKFEQLSKQLEVSDRKEVLESLNQKNIIGTSNYVKNILEQLENDEVKI